MNKNLTWFISSLLLSISIAPVLALNNSIGEKGIDVNRLHQNPYNLTGSKIAIGQVEIGRPGKFGLDKAAIKNPDLELQGVFYRDKKATSNNNIDNHASMVATVMVGKDKRLPGIAPGAKLYSSAVGSLKRNGQPQECIAAQHVAEQNGGDVRAINFSFGESLQRDTRKNAKLDGNALLTQCVDWSARVHDVIYVIAGNQGSGGIPIPTDNYNGITTAYSTKREDIFAKVDFANLSSLPQGVGSSLIEREINVGARRAIGLVAPGNQISVYNLDGKLEKVSGTSFAAPHVTASVALLQEFGDRQLKESSDRWSTDSRRHQVMKAVLLNSTDKLKDTGNGLLLGMTRTLLSKGNQTWLESDAYKDAKIPLDIQMGTGHLNTFRAYEQFSSGQWHPGSSVGLKGWDYRTVTSNFYQDYILENNLAKDSYAAITLTWDRLVELNDRNQNNRFDLDESFHDQGLNNLDVYLMPTNSQNPHQSVCSSTSEVDSIEHIFCKIPASGRYKIRVYYRQQVNVKVQPYALAWWTVGK